MKILIGDFIAKIGREDLLKQTIDNWESVTIVGGGAFFEIGKEIGYHV
jgi:hypothetical protein